LKSRPDLLAARNSALKKYRREGLISETMNPMTARKEKLPANRKLKTFISSFRQPREIRQ